MYKTKTEFLSNLERELGRFGVVDKSEIIADFQQHFADSEALGLNEAQACEKLGDISEIAKSYAEEEIFPAIAVEHEIPPPQNDYSQNQQQQQYQQQPPPQEETCYSYSSDYPEGETPYEKSGIDINFSKPDFISKDVNWGNLIVLLLIDLFILSWALPALVGLILGLLGACVGFVAGGIGVIVGTTIGNVWGFVSPFAPLANVFLGVMLMSLGGLLLVAGICAVRGFVKLIKAIINWHGNMIIGRPVFKEKVKGEQTA